MNKLRDSGIYRKLDRDSVSRPALPDPVYNTKAMSVRQYKGEVPLCTDFKSSWETQGQIINRDRTTISRANLDEPTVRTDFAPKMFIPSLLCAQSLREWRQFRHIFRKILFRPSGEKGDCLQKNYLFAFLFPPQINIFSGGGVGFCSGGGGGRGWGLDQC